MHDHTKRDVYPCMHGLSVVLGLPSQYRVGSVEDGQMAKIRNIETQVKRIQQETDVHCGAACSAMLFAYYEMSISQSDAYKVIRGNNREPNSFYSDPDGIASCLNHANFLPDNIQFNVSDFSVNEADLLSQRIYYNLSILGMPSVVLVNHGNHWLIVDGVRCSESADGDRNVYGYWFTDPFRTQPQRYFVPIDEATSEYFTPNHFGQFWKDKLVLISDDRNQELNLDLIPMRPQPMGGAGLAFHPGGDDPIPQLRYFGYEGVRELIGGGSLQSSPMPIRAIDDGRVLYWLKSLDAINDRELQSLIYIAVEEGSNRLLEMTDDMQKITFIDDASASDLLRQNFPNANTISVVPGYFWKRSIEIRSRFSFVRRAKVDELEVYILPGGEIRTELFMPRKGGA